MITVTEQEMRQITIDLNRVLSRCVMYSKKYNSFSFHKKIDRQIDISRITYVIEILDVKNDLMLNRWEKVITNIVSRTCIKASKAYLSREGILTYYIHPDWKRFVKSEEDNSNWTLPMPKEDGEV
jgi:hypothetical protein